MDRMQEMKQRLLARLPSRQEGKMGYIIAWLLGVPIPVLFLIFLLPWLFPTKWFIPVKPEDALSSVRSAILLGISLMGLRKQER